MPSLNRKLAIMAAASVLACSSIPVGLAFAAEQTLPAPAALVPNVQTFEPGVTAWSLLPGTRIVVDPAFATELGQEATTLAHELASEGHLGAPAQTVLGGPVDADDIHLTLAKVHNNTAEAYEITVNDGLQIRASDAAGAFYASRTLLQVLRTEDNYSGTVTDWPAYVQRGVMVDMARKYYSPEWAEQLMRSMSYRKLNTLQFHMNDGVGFRIESKTHPEIVSPEHWSQDDVRDLLATAARYHIEVVPDIDSPAHLDHVLKVHPEWRLTLRNGQTLNSHLDYSIPEARAFMKELVGEMADLFPGKYFHLGGDEFFPAPWQGNGPDTVTASSAPQLLSFAAEKVGPGATILDGYEWYMNDLIALLKTKNKTAKVWNDDVYPGEGILDLDKLAEVEGWIRWNNSKPNAGQISDAGYDMVNANGDYLYFILTGDGVGTGPNKNPEGIYERWNPRRFMGVAGNGGDYDLPADKPLMGAHLSIWSDNPAALTEQQVETAFLAWQDSFAQQMWGSPKLVASYAAFEPLARSLGAAPAAVNAEVSLVDPAPETAAPTTAAPTAGAPTTAAPTTAAPSTGAPTTGAPTTAAPTTAAPTTAAPMVPANSPTARTGLAMTGSSSNMLLGTAALFMLGGAAFFGLTRRNRRSGARAH
ncbi:family 20 glycosylhydrolase [Arthrobacter psychrochitiniphilus]|uniref:family 20 glycosylhydrolase n=1 Tax=Arthrobacter psychrochitiniphilus TaxID=291045 RepID=UPI003F7B7E85